jgi:hypothetical protein
MSEFTLYLQTGLEHILDAKGYDHILFVLALCSIYRVKDYKKLLWLVTAFTIGHSITLALATLKIVTVNSVWIEFLIPITIILTCISNLFYTPNQTIGIGREKSDTPFILRYLFALFFGLIHGLGFSNFLLALLGKQASISLPLLAFNIGLEIGQLLIVLVFLFITTVFAMLGSKQRDFVLVVSGIIVGFSCHLLIEKWIF